MNTAIMQPYFLPYIGYFQLIHAVDQFVLYDDVTYIKNGWINRNRYLLNGQPKFFTLSLIKASSFTPINQTYILNDEKHKTKETVLKTLLTSYSKAPLCKVVTGLLEEIVLDAENNIALYNENSIRKICGYLNISTKILVSSKINKDRALKSQAKVIDICSILQTKVYINAIGGKTLYNHDSFEKTGMDLKFLRPNLDRINYSQFKAPFLQGLSIVDVLMFNSSADVRAFLNEYILEN